MIADNSTCSLMKLPYELRLRIYEYFLLADSEITIADTRPRFKGHLETQLLRTCQLIYNEAADVLYGSNVFETLLHQNGRLATRHLSKWLRTIHERNVARLNRLKCLLIFPVPSPTTRVQQMGYSYYTTKGNTGLFHVETTFRLRKSPAWGYLAKYQELGTIRPKTETLPGPIVIPLASDPLVEEQLEMRFRTKRISGAPWKSHDISFMYTAISELRPRPAKDADVEQLPEGVIALFGQQSKGSEGETWNQAVHSCGNARPGPGCQFLP